MQTMNEIEQRLAKEMEDALLAAMLGNSPKPHQTALRARGLGFETVELDDAGNVIEPLRCTCGSYVLMHLPKCPFYCLVT